MSFLSGIPILGSIVDGIKGHFEHKRKLKEAELQSKLRINEAVTAAKEKRLSDGQAADIGWENTSIAQAGWKDEWFTVLLSIPAVLCFLPGCEVYVVNGFRALDSCPDWYRWAFLVAVGSAFGYRRIADFMSLKKGVL